MLLGFDVVARMVSNRSIVARLDEERVALEEVSWQAADWEEGGE